MRCQLEIVLEQPRSAFSAIYATTPRAPKGPDGLPLHYKEIAVLALPDAKTLESIDSVVDLSRHIDANGKLAWNAKQADGGSCASSVQITASI